MPNVWEATWCWELLRQKWSHHSVHRVHADSWTLLAQITLTVILHHLEQNFFRGATQSQKNRRNITQFLITVCQLVCAILSAMYYTTQSRYSICKRTPKWASQNTCRNSSSVGREMDSFLGRSSPSSHSGRFITKHRSFFTLLSTKVPYKKNLNYFICTKIKLITISENFQKKKK